MIRTVLYIFMASCLQYASGATRNQVQEISIGGRVVSLNYSMLSASCASETLRLVSATYIAVQTVYNCEAKNETTGICSLDVYPEGYEEKCKNAGGQFYTNQASEVLWKCYIQNSRSITDVSISNYPMCAGASCNSSEVKTAFVETLSADASTGQIWSTLYTACSTFNPFLETSASGDCNLFNVRVTTVVSCVFLLLLY